MAGLQEHVVAPKTTTPAPLPAIPSVCASHEYLERTLDTLVKTTNEGFATLNKTLTDMRVEGARRETELAGSLKSAWHEIRDSKARVAEVERAYPAAIAAHEAGCVLNDITEVGIKVPPKERRVREVSYDTPTHGTRRPSVGARPPLSRSMVALGVGVVLAVVGIGIWIGVALSTGSTGQATGTVRDLAAQARGAEPGQ